MPLVLADRVRDTTTTTGTGTVTLSGTAPTGYQNFSVIGNGNTTYYTINAGSQWEVGIGTYSSTGPTLARNTVLESSNANALVDFAAGVKDVFVTYPSDKSVNYDESNNVGIGTTTPASRLDIASGNLRFSGTGQRILGDMTSGTFTNRLAFQTSTLNSTTNVHAIPNGSATQSGFKAESDPTFANGQFVAMDIVGGSDARFNSSIRGAGTYVPMTFWTGGSERMRITAAGDVGIGTSSPQSQAGFGAFTANGSTGGAIFLTTANTRTAQFYNTDAITVLGSVTAIPLAFQTNNAERMRIDSSGNVGIGTSSPFADTGFRALDIRGSTGGQINLGTNSGREGEITSTATNGLTLNTINTTPIRFFTNGTERARIDSSGNVGIGTSSPATTLSVVTNTTAHNGMRVTNNSTTQFAGSGLQMLGPSAAGAQGGAGIYYYNTTVGGTQGGLGIAQLNSAGSFQRNLAYYDFNGQSWAFLTNGSERLTINNAGVVTANVDIRAPIFYDSNNTGYYIDGAATSQLFTLQIASGFGSFDSVNDPYAKVSVSRNTDANYAYYGLTRVGQMVYQMGIDTSNRFWIGGGTGGYNGVRTDTYLSFSSAGDVTAKGDMRAPIFYDSQNTAFYVDAATAGISANFAGSLNAATNNLAGLRVNASSTASSGGAIAIQQATVEGWTGIFCDYEPFTGYGIWADNGNDIISFTGEASTGGIRSFSVPSRSSGLRTAFEKFRVEQNTGDTITGRDGYANSSFRAPIYYDSNNTGFYLDPASTSVLNNLIVGGGQNASTITMADANEGERYIHCNSNRIGFLTQAGGWGSYCIDDGAWFSDTAVYSPIYYDLNNTNFYLDAAANSILNVVTVSANDTSSGGGVAFGGTVNSQFIRGRNSDGASATASNLQLQSWFGIGFGPSISGQAVPIGENAAWVDCRNGDLYGRRLVIAGQDMRAPLYYDSNDTFFYLNPNGYSQINGFGSVNGSSGIGLNIMGNPSNGAVMAFHRSAAFAINMGLDTDNVFRMGGWSAAANRLQMDMSGNLTMAGNVTAFSDIRLKKDIETIDGALDLVSKMRGVRFTRIENEERNVGVIAQEMLEVCPEVVQQGVGDDDTLSVAYGNLVGVLIEAIKELRAEVAELKGN